MSYVRHVSVLSFAVFAFACAAFTQVPQAPAAPSPTVPAAAPVVTQAPAVQEAPPAPVVSAAAPTDSSAPPTIPPQAASPAPDTTQKSGPATQTKNARVRTVVNIAVSDLLGKGVSQPEADLITEQVRASMLATGTFKVMERSMMDQIMKEQGFQQSGSCDNSECMVSVGRVLGVQNLVVGSVGQVGRIFMINVKLVDVTTGEVLKSLTETCECTIEQLLQQTPDKVAGSLDFEVRKSVAGTMQIVSQPAGATVFLDHIKVGATPWKSSLLDPGQYDVSLVMQDWKRIDRKVLVETGKLLPLNLTMDRSDEWLAAKRAEEERAKQAELAKQAEIKRQQEAARSQKKLMWRIGLSALSALCVGSGYYFQTLADESQASSDKSYERYRTSRDQLSMDLAKADIESQDKLTDKNRTMRNISYGLGAAALASISFTFFF